MAEGSAEKLKKKANPESYIKLAKISLGLKEFQLAATSCEKGLAKFPKHPGLLVAKGETLVSAYSFGKKIEYLKTAMTSFEQALKVAPHNYIAKFLTGQIYLQFRKYEKAIDRFSSILETDPNDDRAKVFLKKAKSKLSPPQKSPEKPKTVPIDEKENLPVELPVKEKEIIALENQKEVVWETTSEDESVHHDFLISRLPVFNKIEGLIGVNLMDSSGNILKQYKESNMEPELTCSMVGNIYRATNRVMNEFNSGDFVYSMVMCQNAFLYVVDVRWALLVLETSPDINQEIIEKKIHQYLGELDR